MPDAQLSAEAAVVFSEVTVTRGDVPILEGVTAMVPRGSVTAIVGPNGAGKTTLLLALLGEIPYCGSITTHGRPGNGGVRIGYVPQRLTFDRGIPLTVTEFLMAGVQRRPLWLGVSRGLREQSLHLLDSLNARYLAERTLGALSAGELQRVLLALALRQDPDLLLLDEPAAGIDFQGEYVFCEMLDILRERNLTQLMVSHDLATVMHHADHVICLNRRVAAEGPPKAVLTREILSLVFGPHMGLVDLQALANGAVGPCGRRPGAPS